MPDRLIVVMNFDKTASKVLHLTNKIVSENNLTTLMITHNMHDAISAFSVSFYLCNAHNLVF